jgi:hypothetical protein
MTEPLNVLVLESEVDAASVARDDLMGAGHKVFGCHEPGVPAFPCNALAEGHECPLLSEVVDVALVVRSRPRSQPAPREDGVRCALQQHVPLVVAGSTLLNPFDAYATEVVDRDADVVDAVERAARSPMRHHTERAANALREVLDRRGVHASPLVAVVRHKGVLVIEVRVAGADALDHETKSMAAVRMTAAVRAFDPNAKGVDVVFETA